MKFSFVKYQATGNDFVVMDNRDGSIHLTTDQIQRICDRRFGVGADGLMLIGKHPSLDFNLEYFNADGTQSLCGNGSRAAVKMAATLGLVQHNTSFQAYDGPHQATLGHDGIVTLRMTDVKEIRRVGDDWFINTGSPHLIRFVDDVGQYPVFEEGRRLRYSEAFKPGGTNVNFVELRKDNTIYVRTYERGVENETLSCGTGVTAAALAVAMKGYHSPVNIETKGGNLSVAFVSRLAPAESVTFTDIFLIGPAKMVFEGTLDL